MEEPEQKQERQHIKGQSSLRGSVWINLRPAKAIIPKTKPAGNRIRQRNHDLLLRNAGKATRGSCQEISLIVESINDPTTISVGVAAAEGSTPRNGAMKSATMKRISVTIAATPEPTAGRDPGRALQATGHGTGSWPTGAAQTASNRVGEISKTRSTR